MRNALNWLLGLTFTLNGLAMFLAPETWYALTPGVPETGPFNPHFVRDVGCAYLVCGGALLALVFRPALWPPAMAAAIFQILHSLTHVWGAATGMVAQIHILSDLLLVVLPTVLMLWLAWPPREPRV
ncbi:MAG: hypothetical protein ACREXT_00185 [Gammaproteobacteria bacterium]